MFRARLDTVVKSLALAESKVVPTMAPSRYVVALPLRWKVTTTWCQMPLVKAPDVPVKLFALPGAPARFHRKPPSAARAIPQPGLFALAQFLLAISGNSPVVPVHLTQNDTEKSVSVAKVKSAGVPRVG